MTAATTRPPRLLAAQGALNSRDSRTGHVRKGITTNQRREEHNTTQRNQHQRGQEAKTGTTEDDCDVTVTEQMHSVGLRGRAVLKSAQPQQTRTRNRRHTHRATETTIRTHTIHAHGPRQTTTLTDTPKDSQETLTNRLGGAGVDDRREETKRDEEAKR